MTEGWNTQALGTGKGLEVGVSILAALKSQVPSRIPGYGGCGAFGRPERHARNIPGKLSETVHGSRFAEANATAQSLRALNPAVTCEGWLKRGVWPVAWARGFRAVTWVVLRTGCTLTNGTTALFRQAARPGTPVACPVWCQTLFSPAQDQESLELRPWCDPSRRSWITR